MKILVVAQNLTPGDGWGTIARNTVEGLQARDHEVCVLLHDLTDANICPAMQGLPPALSPLGSPLSWIKTALAIRKSVKKFQPDIIHFAVETYALGMPLVRYFLRLPPWIIVMLGTYTVQPLYLWNTRWLMRRVYQQCDSFPVCSEYTKGQYLNAIEETCGTSLRSRVEDRSPLFRLGIVPPDSHNGKKTGTVKRILFVGGVKPRKGVLDLIKGLRAYAEVSTVPFHADIIGALNEKSDYTRRIREEIVEGELTDVVTLHGHASREMVDKAYANADVFIMLSKPDGLHFEGFGVVFLEANILGIPTIGPDGSGCKEAVDEGVSGFTVDPEDPKAVATRLQWILENSKIEPQDCITWAARHSVDQQVASYEAVYISILGK
jgi:glycosyltransferase involved in cell wall biosynthesis